MLGNKAVARGMYEAGIADSEDIVTKVLSLYGPGNSPEKTIMMIVDMCKKTGCTISDIAFEDDSLIYTSGAPEGETPKTQIFKSGVSLSISSGYTQLKKVNDYINSYVERMNAENFTINFDSHTGKLNITMKVNMYSVVDDNHTYVAPVIEDIDLGSTNIFKTYEAVLEEEEENAGEEGAETPEPNAEENNTTE